jgi:hypothetical protein
MRIAIEILKKSLISLSDKQKDDVKKAIEILHSELYEYDQDYTNIYNIEEALYFLENGKAIQNGEDREIGFVTYFKEGNKYYTSYNGNADKISEISFNAIKSHVENYTLETNHYFFKVNNPKIY